MNISEVLNNIKKELHNSIDVVSRDVSIGDVDIGFIYLKSMTNSQIFADSIYKPISKMQGKVDLQIVKDVIQAKEVSFVSKDEIIDKILGGVVIIALSNSEEFIGVDIQEFLTRTPAEPPTSPVIMGQEKGLPKI